MWLSKKGKLKTAVLWGIGMFDTVVSVIEEN